MPVFTAGAAAIATAIGFTAGTTGFIIAQSLIAAGLAAGAGHLLGVFDDGGLPAVEDPGVEQRLGANTQNRVPILYGQFMQRGALTYAEITEDRKTLYTVITIGEGPVTSIDSIYWDDILLTLDANGEVTAGVDVEGNAVTRLNGQINVQTYLGTATGNNSTYLEGLVTDWTSNHKMTNLVYAVVTVRYNRDNDVTNLSDMRFIGTAPINSPAEAVIDQLTNVRHGLGLSPTVIDSDSFNDALVYYQTMLPYTDAAGNTQMAERFQVNGSLNSADPVFERIEAILLGSNSSLRWQGGKYSIFINKADTVEAFNMNESRVVGDIQVSEVGLNSVVNSVEVQYGRDPNNNYQRNTVTVDLPTANRYPNELDRVRSIDLPLARTFVEAERIAYILLNQSREQLSIKHVATVEAMPLEAGDVITYTLPNYGWDEKQFRITRVSEMETEDGLQYEIEAVEYAASVYTDRTHVEPGASPNTNIPPAGELNAVTDLALSSTSPEAASPNFVLQWTVPTGLYERFDIFVNNLQAPFNTATTTFIKSVYPNASSYTSGNTVTDAVYGLPAGSYNIWVVGRNSLASSAESNAAVLNGWQPLISTGGLEPGVGAVSIRLHENIATMDPGAPTGAQGIGGGWYDPEGEYGTIPADPDPHWEARGVGELAGGTNRVVNFTSAGTAGSIVSTTSDVQQVAEYTFTGTAGQRVQTGFDRPEVTEFTFSGSSAEVAGSTEYWALDFTGSSDATTFTPGFAVNEEFYIYLAGSTPSPTTVSFNNTVVTPTTYTAGTDVAVNGYIQVGAGVHGQLIQINMEDSATTVAALNAYFGTTSVSMNQASLQANPIAFTITNPSGDTYTANLTGQNSQNFSINLNSALGGYFMTLSVGDQNNPIPPADRANFPTGTVITWSFPDRAADITASSVQVSIPTETINETFTLTNSLTGSTALRNDLLTSIQANAAITNEFTATADVASGIAGITDGEPIVKLTANDTTDHSIGVTFTDGDGDLTGSAFGSIVDGAGMEDVVTTATEIRVAYDQNISPSFQDIVLGAAADGNAIATTVASMIDSHGELNAVVGSGVTSNEGANENSTDVTFAYDGAEYGFTDSSGGTPATWSDLARVFGPRDGDFETASIAAVGSGSIVIQTSASSYAVFSIQEAANSFPDSFRLLVTHVASVGTPNFSGSEEILISSAPAATTGAYVTAAEATFDVTLDPTASRVIVYPSRTGEFDQPVLSIEERGTSDAFTQTASTLFEGVDSTGVGVHTAWAVFVAGTSVATGAFASDNGPDLMADDILPAINGLTTHTATASGAVVTTTSIANSSDDITIVITTGTNDAGSTAANNAAVARVVTEEGGTVDTFTGIDAIATIQISDEDARTVNVGGMTPAEVASAIIPIVTQTSRYTSVATSNVNRTESVFLGPTPTLTVTVNPGILPDGTDMTAGTLAVDTNQISNGIGTIVSGGRLGTFSIQVGTAAAVTGTFTDAADANTMSQELVTAILGNVSNYGAIRADNVLTATSTFEDSTPDITITIDAGLNADDTAATATIVKAVVAAGEAPGMDFTNTQWTYYVINQEIRVDDDTVDMGADNTIAVRRGLILDSTSIQGGSYTTAVGTPIVIPTTHTVGNKPATLVVTGGATLGAQASAAGSTVGFTVEYSVDGGTTWLAGQSSDLLQIGAGAGLDGQLLLPTLGGNFAADVAAGVTVSFRITKTGTDTNMLILSQFLILEELRAV